MNAKIDVSAQFGGGRSNELVPHYTGLKEECVNFSLVDFPFPELSFILRVDGSLAKFGLSGPGFVSFARKGDWVSVDIGVPEAVHEQGERQLAEFIAAALLAAVDVLRVARRKVMAMVDWDAVRDVLHALGEAYKQRMLQAPSLEAAPK